MPVAVGLIVRVQPVAISLNYRRVAQSWRFPTLEYAAGDSDPRAWHCFGRITDNPETDRVPRGISS